MAFKVTTEADGIVRIEMTSAEAVKLRDLLQRAITSHYWAERLPEVLRQFQELVEAPWQPSPELLDHLSKVIREAGHISPSPGAAPPATAGPQPS